MSLEAQLQALTVPEGTEFPGTVQALLNLIAQYEAITGLQDFNGINYGATEPSADNRDRPWFKTDESGNPIGWFSWNGASWASIPLVLPSGATANRPVSPDEGTQYLDTDIDVALVYLNGGWTTLAGSPGDIKQVTGTSLSSVLTKNPGWAHYTAGIGRVLAGAAADGSDAETDVGADEVTLTEAQLPPHTHTTYGSYGSGGEGGADNPLYYDAAQAPVVLKDWPLTGSTGDGDPVSVVQLTRYVFTLYKL